MATQDLGAVTAYAEAVAGGYTGTKAQFEAMLANIGNVTETDPTVPAWAKAETKPAYSTSEITGLVAALSNKQAAISASGILKGDGSGSVSAAARGTDFSLINAPVTVSVPYTGWVQNGTTSAYEQSVAVTGLLTTDDKRTRVELIGTTDVATQALLEAAYGNVNYVACNTAGYLYMRCDSAAPETTFSVAVIIER